MAEQNPFFFKGLCTEPEYLGNLSVLPETHSVRYNMLELLHMISTSKTKGKTDLWIMGKTNIFFFDPKGMFPLI